MNFYRTYILAFALAFSGITHAASNVIEKQLADIGSIQNDEVVVVQRKYTRKIWRSEFTPVTLGGIPFGTVRRTLFGGASYTLHASDLIGLELFNFVYSKTFFSSFTDDINGNKERTGQADIKPDFQRLLYFLTGGIQLTPFYGKMSTFSRYIAYMEPYLSLSAGFAKTESDGYFTWAPGIGFRVFFREWFSMKLEFRDYLYTEKFTDRNTGAPASALRNNYSVMVAFSFWLPKMPR